MPSRLLATVRAERGDRWIDQCLPSQRSTNDSEAPVSGVMVPTAVQAVGDAHDTPSRASSLSVSWAGLGVRWIDQRLPSQRSANVTMAPARLLESPTAVQTLGETHETAFRWLSPLRGRLGVRWIDQRLPSQRSANVTEVPARPVKSPTAVQRVAETHDTPPSSSSTASPVAPTALAPGGVTSRSIDQTLPFQRSASIAKVPDRFAKIPIAMHADVDTHDTPSSSLPFAPRGVGMRCPDQVVPSHLSAKLTDQ